MNRRTYLKTIAALVAAPSLLEISGRESQASPQPKPTAAEQVAIANIAQGFMVQYGVPGMSVAFARRGQMVYQKAFGYSSANQAATTSSRFRIASVTKPFTSAAIFSLIEKGRLKLEAPVFGPHGVLGYDYGKSYQDVVNHITIHHLLTHTCGGWENTSNDPMFMNVGMSQHDLIAWTLGNVPLKYEPGTHYDYSNFGYCVLGRVIEKVSGQPYAKYVQQHILAPCGVREMQIATNERAHDEVQYVGQNGENPYNMNISRMDSHGGWIATASDLVKFAIHCDGFKSPPDLLSAQTVRTMTTASPANSNYACGWAVNNVPNWWHIGSLPGTTSVMVRTASGFCWAALTNSRRDGIDSAIDQMMWNVAHAVSRWQA